MKIALMRSAAIFAAMIRVLTSSIFSIVILVSAAGAQTPSGVERLVPPSPVPAGYIADAAGVVPADAESAINARIEALQAAGRGDIAVAVLPDIADYRPYEVGVAIYRAWGVGSVAEIGSARRDLGALLLIVPKELASDGRGHCWITTGRGAEGLLTDGVVAEICRELVVPSLRERDYGGAILAGIDGVDRVLRGDPALAGEPTPLRGQESGSRGTGPLAWLAGIVASIVASIGGVFGLRRWRRTRPRTCPTCGNLMHRVDEAADDEYLDRGQQVEERVKSVDYDVWLCGSCGTQRPERYARWITSYKACPACDARTARTKRRVIDAATTSSTGMAEDTTTCEACDYRKVEEVVLPKVTASASGGGGSGGGSSGGSSFGGSGATSGGGGGSSY
jgi:uncharacterized protein